jgi:PhoPQ-activated pathogenicity-related protein
MVHLNRQSLVFVSAALVCPALMLAGVRAGEEMPSELIDYVKARDEAFRWELRSKSGQDGWTRFEVTLTSQAWQGTTWKHSLSVALPPPASGVADDAAMLFLGRDMGPGETLESAVRAAGIACITMDGIPNAGLFGLPEGQLMRHAERQYMATGDPAWMPLCPMVKSVARAMDAIGALTAVERPVPVKRFVLLGHSKRGVTAWLSAAADPRVIGIVPMGADLLNLPAQFAGWPRLRGILLADPEQTQREAGRRILTVMDPYNYRRNLAIPKLNVSGSNDPAYPTAGVNLFWNDMPDPKWLLYVPNRGHNEPSDPRTAPASYAFARAVASGKGLPQITATFEEPDGNGKATVRLRLTTSAPAASAQIWTAQAAGRDLHAARWESRLMSPAGANGRSFQAEVARPESACLGAFGEVTFRDDGRTYALTTAMHLSGP